MKTGRPDLESGAAQLSIPQGSTIIHFINVNCKRFLAGVFRSSKMPRLALLARWPVVRVKNQIQALRVTLNLVRGALVGVWAPQGHLKH